MVSRGGGCEMPGRTIRLGFTILLVCSDISFPTQSMRMAFCKDYVKDYVNLVLKHLVKCTSATTTQV